MITRLPLLGQKFIEGQALSGFTMRGKDVETTHHNVIDTFTKVKEKGVTYSNISSNVVVYYPFVGNTTTSLSKNLVAVTVSNIIWTGSPAQNDGYVTLNGTTQFGDTGLYCNTSDVTFNFWVNTNNMWGGDAIHRFFGLEDFSQGIDGLAVYNSSATTYTLVQRNSGSSYDMLWHAGVITGTWYMYSLTISSTLGSALYVNGQLTNSNGAATAYSHPPGTPTFHLGVNGLGNTIGCFDGSIGACHYFERALTSNEIDQIWQSTKSKYGY